MINFSILNFTFSFSSIVLLMKIILFSFWFSIGVWMYFYNPKFKKFVDTTSWYEMFIIIYLLFLIINGLFYLTSNLISDMLLVSYNLDFEITNHLAGESSGNNNPIPKGESVTKTNSSSSGATASDGAIMTAALVAGSQLDKNMPSTSGKVTATGLGVALGGTAIVIKNVAGNISSQLGKFNLIGSEDLQEVLSSLFNLSGNNGLDLLNLILFCNSISVTLTLSLFYLLFCSYTDEHKLKRVLLKIFPLILVNFYFKAYMAVKKRSLILIVILLLLILFSNYLTYYYLGFYIENLDKIVEIYFKKQ